MRTTVDVSTRNENNIEYWTYDIHIKIDNEKAIATSIEEAIKAITNLFEKLEAVQPDACQPTANGIYRAAMDTQKYFGINNLV